MGSKGKPRSGLLGMMASADILEFELHAPQAELSKLQGPLEELVKVPIVYWAKVDGAFYVPEKLDVKSVAHAANSVVGVNVYWKACSLEDFCSHVLYRLVAHALFRSA